ncbi:hypothetical protein P22_2367 [Propionispora sp. 2/2-37]|uniref:[FeFe] hydrogenase H-cluster radical SAM maturase HydE n=1 Tax=Propionispora sp. 2/2-37 TaxID=1677858 RepID=UPI0006BB6374|nr:[FeFe] hydrogenase H-cluster radical SAM maturase HydE [Propionispora sp. 2/2-37]CUH96277.1 hypothetical protein P22_2367 [Propionispora sp. 2/2-37]
MQAVLKHAESTHQLQKQDIVRLLEDEATAADLFAAADRVRAAYVGNEVHLRGLIEFSNTCKQNCLYCGLRRDNKKITRYRLMPDMIVELARKAQTYGYKTVVLQSGEDPYYSLAMMQEILLRIKTLGLAITLSIGEKTREEYQAYREAGADRYLLRIETTDQALYEQLNPGMNFLNRLRCLQDLKELGYEVGTGIMVGLPGQSLESLAQDILFFKAINADMIGLGPFISNPDTPLKAAGGGEFSLALKVMAITRLLLPDSNIPATTAMEALNKQGRTIALQSGANVVMPNVTEGEYRELYMLYPGKICINDTPAHCRQCIGGKIAAIGRSVAQHAGFRNRKSPEQL